MNAKTSDAVAGLRADAERIAAMVAELRSLGLIVVDPAALDEASERSIPLIRGLARAALITKDVAAVARKEGQPCAAVLGEAAGLIADVTQLIERRLFVGLVLPEDVSPAAAGAPSSPSR